MAPLLLHAFSTFAVGGPQVRFASLANRFGPAFRHAVVAMDGNIACRERLDPALDVAFPTVPFRKGDMLGNLRVLRAALRSIRPAKLFTSNWGSIEWALANRVAVVPHIHVEDGFLPDERHLQVKRRVRLRRLALAGRTVVVPSLTLRTIAIETWRLNPQRVQYVPNGVDLARFAPAGPRAAEIPIIGTIAALRPEKNLARLLRAFAAGVPHGRLVVAGDGPQRPELEFLAQSLGIADRVHWAGHLADPVPLLRTLDIFALSSDTEQMPLTLLEAMAAGLPVASTDVGDVAAILPPEQRALVTPLEDAPLATALRSLAQDPATRIRLGQANRARAEAEYGQDRMFAAWHALFN